MVQKDLEKIISYGTMAPSGENCQPWKFKVQGSTLSVINIPEADQSIYNSQQKGSYIAHGALIENMCICANDLGYETIVSIFPTSDETHVADIIFNKMEISQRNQLCEYIPERCTNRKEFSGKKLSSQEKKNLADSIIESDYLVFVDDNEVVKELGVALAVNEVVLFENKKIHDFFYEHIIWDKKDENKAGGFFIDTLEFLPHQLGAVKLFKNWKVLSFFNAFLGVSKKISKENGEKYARSGTVGAILIDTASKESYLAAGRNMQRVWLAATRLGLAFHPCNGTIYFFDHIKNEGGSDFSKVHTQLIQDSYKKICEIFNASHKQIAFIFRVGHAGVPSAKAKRMPPVVTYLDTVTKNS